MLCLFGSHFYLLHFFFLVFFSFIPVCLIYQPWWNEDFHIILGARKTTCVLSDELHSKETKSQDLFLKIDTINVKLDFKILNALISMRQTAVGNQYTSSQTALMAKTIRQSVGRRTARLSFACSKGGSNQENELELQRNVYRRSTCTLCIYRVLRITYNMYRLGQMRTLTRCCIIVGSAVPCFSLSLSLYNFSLPQRQWRRHRQSILRATLIGNESKWRRE